MKAARPSTRAIEAPPAQDPFLNPVVSVVVGKNMKDIFYDFDNIQSDDWGWGAAAACVTSRPARARERRLPQKTTPQVSSTPLTRTPRTRDACRWANPEIGTRGRRRNLRLDETKPVWANSCGVGLRASPSFQLWKSEHEHAIFKGTIIARGTALRRTKKAGSKKVV